MAGEGNQNAKGNKGGGRRTVYSASMIPALVKACRSGLTDVEIGQLLRVSERTINAWKAKHPEFSAALKEGKDEADATIERSLFERARGYSHPAVKILQYEGEPVVVPYTEHYAPDTTACIFWLKNRRPHAWRDKIHVDQGVDFAAALKHARERAVATGGARESAASGVANSRARGRSRASPEVSHHNTLSEK